ncbi:LysM peptidoglycan-binding domain-containing protein [Marinobacterium marinum]|uniref:LysM peptidoglycan-binding domain-containing protein n=1 Tax=Marinobacterium marinum TaxID=2756129 RepID=A0A7W1WZ06_9GAMM|nr:LysM domain-containing protein [Marinobacterium marinum]MBA4502816.1 LysM peptidoglycan-binding domain-containing protein [Marinobacterium marinum]
MRALPFQVGVLSVLLALPTTPALAIPTDNTYTVRPGDTLSSIAAHTLGDGQRWREIWSLNPNIRTPQQLHVGVQLKLPSVQPTLQQPSVALSSPSRPQQTGAALLMAQDLQRSGHLDRIRTDYRLLDTRAPSARQRIQAVHPGPDALYLELPPLSPAIGALYGLFKPTQGGTGKDSLKLMRVGTATSVPPLSGHSRLRVIDHQPLSLQGLYVLPLNKQPALDIQYPPAPVNARILSALYEQAGGYLLLLDQGQQAGIRPGHLLSYHKPTAVQTAPASTTQTGGWILILDSGRETSLALVLQARQVPAVNDLVR